MEIDMTREEAIKELRGFIGQLTEGCQEAIKVLIPELRESEDERTRKWILEYLYEGLRKTDEQFKEQFKSAIAWLEKQKEQKPEWSEEDEKKIHFLSRLIEFQVKDDEYIFGDGSRMISKQEAIKMLQSLRPQSHWRPSEKQMDRLFSIVAALRKDYCDDMADFLASIYKDLKKLM